MGHCHHRWWRWSSCCCRGGTERCYSNYELAVSSTTVQGCCKGIGSEYNLMSGRSPPKASTPLAERCSFEGNRRIPEGGKKGIVVGVDFFVDGRGMGQFSAVFVHHVLGFLQCRWTHAKHHSKCWYTSGLSVSSRCGCHLLPVSTPDDIGRSSGQANKWVTNLTHMGIVDSDGGCQHRPWGLLRTFAT